MYIHSAINLVLHEIPSYLARLNFAQLGRKIRKLRANHMLKRSILHFSKIMSMSKYTKLHRTLDCCPLGYDTAWSSESYQRFGITRCLHTYPDD
jgi:hypothetical protein